ncbi:mitoferrin-2-like [Fundulus heteroclitus]|uniref:mitoferrin-2-like n=1 Tax=Fundulus heteroclitus TaxID=8078 RepID=UPI00165B71F1|nr:mitoferrin-2-like [Fundulus heteroclitus]
MDSKDVELDASVLPILLLENRLPSHLTGFVSYPFPLGAVIARTPSAFSSLTSPAHVLPVVKQRMQMYKSPYRGVLDCVRAVWQREGPGAFYRSYPTQLTMNVPFQVLHFMTYEYLQELLNPHRQYNPSSHMLSGGLAGAIAAATTTPLDVCKTLLNTQESQALSSSGQSQGAHRRISGLVHAFRTVYRLGGLQGFFKGVQARVIYQMPSTAISWSVYEFFKYGLTKHQHENMRIQHIKAEV